MRRKYVDVRRRITKGAPYRIHPSTGFAGIERGMVEVRAILDYKEALDAWETKELVEDVPVYKTEPWVSYSYRDDPNEEEYVLPLELFSEHTTMY